MSSPRVDKGHIIFQNIQVSRPLLELCGRHVVVLRMKVPQIAPFRQIVDLPRSGYHLCLLLAGVRGRCFACCVSLSDGGPWLVCISVDCVLQSPK